MSGEGAVERGGKKKKRIRGRNKLCLSFGGWVTRLK